MEQAAVAFFWLAFAGIICASVLFAYELLLRRKISVSPQLVTAIGFVALTASIGLNSVANGGTPFTGANQLILAAWALVILYFVVEYILKFKNYGMIIVPIVAALMVVAQLIGASRSDIAPIPTALTSQMASAGIAVHVAMIVFANMLFLIAAVSCALYLYQTAQLKNHSTSILSRRLPALSNLEKLSVRAISIALPVYLSGQLLGVIRAIFVDAAGWWADPRIMMSGLVLLIFALFLFMHQRNTVSGQTTSWIGVLGGAFVIILMILARTLPIGFHVFGVLG